MPVPAPSSNIDGNGVPSMNLRSLFLKEQWDATEERIGEHAVLRYPIEMPSLTVECVVLVVDERWIVHLSAEEGFDSEVAGIALDQVRRAEFSPTLVSVVATDYSPHARFTHTAFAPPAVRLFDHLSEELRSKVILAAPGYGSEFKDGMTAQDFRHQIGRKDGWRVRLYKWDRAEKQAPSWP
jgi:hypothetical protein